MTVQVVFTHDDSDNTWVVEVEGAEDQREAREAFSAVVLTCMKLKPLLLPKTKVVTKDDDTFTIIPAVPGPPIGRG